MYVVRMWLRNEPKKLKQVFSTVLQALVMIAGWVVISIVAVKVLQITFKHHGVSDEVHALGHTLLSGPIGVLQFVFILGLDTLIEEFFFRALPLFVVVRYLRGRAWAIALVVVGSSALFGFMHGDLLHVPFQGVIGIIFSLSYLKCGGLRGAMVKPLTITWFIHFLWDTFVIYLSAILFQGQGSFQIPNPLH
jgi:membrane protease YdiL (CAAX protease family)